MNIGNMVLLAWSVLASASAAEAQFFLTCQTGTLSELRQNIEAHSEHTRRLDEKFLTGYYRQKEMPSDFSYAHLEDVQSYLSTIRKRHASVLFYAHNEGNNRLCVWLIMQDEIHSQTIQVSRQELGAKPKELMDSMGVTGKATARSPKVKSRGAQPDPDEQTVDRDKDHEEKVLKELSEMAFPGSIASKLIDRNIDTLIIVPIGDLGTVPFSSLRVQDKPVVELMSIFIAPGFGSFKRSSMPRPQRPQQLRKAIVAGDPMYPKDPKWILPQLPGARKEAEEVARSVNTTPLIGATASKKAVNGQLSNLPYVDLIYLATHGMANATNPLEASALWMSDGQWRAKEIQNLRLGNSRPLVVMSACQTGLGKDFDVGTIGMARAWHRAGASNVVMSLWNIDDAATMHLMTRFITLAKEMPVDKALQAAMKEQRGILQEPALWAGFSIFGLP